MAYDSAGRVSLVKAIKERQNGIVVDVNKTYASSFGYTPHGAIKEVKLGNNLWEHTTFNSRLQPTQIGLGATSTSASVLGLDYTYGVRVNGVLDSSKNNGNIEGQTITAPGLNLTQRYTYDELNRLNTATETGFGLRPIRTIVGAIGLQWQTPVRCRRPSQQPSISGTTG